MDLVVLINRENFKVTTQSRLIKGSGAVGVTDADELLRQAQAYARDIRDKAEKRFEEERERGYAEGLQAAQLEWTERLGAAQAVRHLVLKNIGPSLVDIVVDAVSVILKDANPQHILESALLAVDDLIRRAKWATFRVHPCQLEVAHLALNRFSQGSGCDWVSIIGDPMLPVDGCVFETDAGTADASFSTQLQFVRRAMESAVNELLLNGDTATAVSVETKS